MLSFISGSAIGELSTGGEVATTESLFCGNVVSVFEVLAIGAERGGALGGTGFSSPQEANITDKLSTNGK